METKEWSQAGYKVVGRVQGVGYRWWARQVATELGVCGTAENWPDGSVVIHATAPPEALEAFAMQLAKGPWAASVDRIESVPSEGRLSTDGFEILL
ncbi:MAG: hypothetical protein BMS9Abin29_2238 [Gemmatimonadota bacterium]|nr:MAG: hypothetical protein BMS9Abin29_2238 [Gemmatimonadota bacterium]